MSTPVTSQTANPAPKKSLRVLYADDMKELRQLLEVVLGPLWVWLADGERPATATLAGGAVVVVAVAIQATAGDATVPRRASRRLRKDVGMEITEHPPL